MFCSMSSDQIPVVAAVIADGENVLVCKRPAQKRHGELWEFPGGKVLPGESFEAALSRELLEELDVSLTAVGSTLFTSPDPDSPFVIHFIEVSIAGTPSAIEHTELSWSRFEDLDLGTLAPSDRAFVQYYLHGATED